MEGSARYASLFQYHKIPLETLEAPTLVTQCDNADKNDQPSRTRTVKHIAGENPSFVFKRCVLNYDGRLKNCTTEIMQ